MLVIKVYATKKVPIREGESVEKGRTHHTDLELIDEIHIKNLGEIAEGVYKYGITKPKGVKAQISHIRDDGYMPLLAKALTLLSKPARKEYNRRGG